MWYKIITNKKTNTFSQKNNNTQLSYCKTCPLVYGLILKLIIKEYIELLYGPMKKEFVKN